MKRLLLCSFLLGSCIGTASAAEPFVFRDGDRVVFLGNTLIEREQRHGYWETALTASHPGKSLTFRNLGWSGDTVWGEARARFGGPADGFKHLREHVAALKPTVIIVGYGLNESFAGPPGLPKFEKGLDTLLDTLAATRARIVLLGPPRQEDLGPPLPNPAENNKNIKLYADVLRKAAEKRGYLFVDLYDLRGTDKQPLTDNGIHLTEYGYWRSADVLANALCGRSQPISGDIDVDGEVNGWSFAFGLDQLPRPPQPGSDGTPPAPSFVQVLRYPNLAAGDYRLSIDGKQAVKAEAAEWAKGVALPAGPDVNRVEKLRRTIIDKNQTYFHRWRPQNETYLFGFRKKEQGQNAKEIPEFDPLIEDLEEEIALLKIPLKHRYRLRPEK